ncbi:MAG TPA: hypothetical protein VIL71_18430 [Spirillospora sp.]
MRGRIDRIERIDRWRRRFGFDTNDLRRPVDRVQWRVGLLLLAVFLGVTPPLTAHVAAHVHDAGERAERRDAATWRRVDATVVEVGALRAGHRVTVTWTEPDGTRRSGDFTTMKPVRPGDPVLVWTRDGAVTAARPGRHGLTVVDTVAAGTGVVLATGLSLLGVYLLVRRRCDRRRDRLWDVAWARFDNHRIEP